MSQVISIAAMSKNHIIGINGKIPWHISEDFKRFKSLTLNHPCIMGRKTYESLPIKPLPQRENIILSSNKDLKIEGAIVFNSYEKAIEYAKNKSEKVFIIGGAKIYELGLKYSDVLELTIIAKEIDGDTYYPKFDKNKFQEISRIEKFDEKFGKYFFVTYKKI